MFSLFSGYGNLTKFRAPQGFIASHVINEFVANGYTVSTTVRGKTAERVALMGALGVEPHNVFEADLLNPRGWDEAVAGQHLVMHVASPFFFLGKEAKTYNFVEPAVLGTRHVLEACARHTCVERVVLTSSIAAVAQWDHRAESKAEREAHARPEDCYRHFSEEDWCNGHPSNGPYIVSKTLAERWAWIFMGMNGRYLSFDLVSVCPAGVIGPIILPPTCGEHGALNQGDQMLLKVLNKEFPGYPKIASSFVDVRDVARLHFLCGTNRQARGRYLCVADKVMFYGELADAAVAHLPLLAHHLIPGCHTLPDLLVEFVAVFSSDLNVKQTHEVLHFPMKFSNDRSKTLGMSYRDLGASVADAALSIAKFEPTMVKEPLRSALLEKLKSQ